jgi:hypothetical protein
MMLRELRKVIPSFLQRVDQPERGGAWAEYLAATRRDTARVVERLWPESVPGAGGAGASDPRGAADDVEVTLLDFDPEGEDKVLAAICFPHSTAAEEELLRRVRSLGAEDRAALLRAYIGERLNRRHRPGRAFERTDYRFEITADYGAFRDLQRHRLLTVEWQPLGVSLGYDLPESVVEAGVEHTFVESLERSRELHDVLAGPFPAQAPYAVALAYRIRFIMQMNAREALHVIELRSGPQGHPAYRKVAQKMHRAIAEVAGHRAIAAAMTHVDLGTVDLARLDAERRAERKRQSRKPGKSATS